MKSFPTLMMASALLKGDEASGALVALEACHFWLAELKQAYEYRTIRLNSSRERNALPSSTWRKGEGK